MCVNICSVLFLPAVQMYNYWESTKTGIWELFLQHKAVALCFSQMIWCFLGNRDHLQISKTFCNICSVHRSMEWQKEFIKKQNKTLKPKLYVYQWVSWGYSLFTGLTLEQRGACYITDYYFMWGS